MAEERVLVKFGADIGDLKTQLLDIETQLNKLASAEKKTEDQQKATSKEVQTASQKRVQALKNEQAELARLKTSLKQAFTPADIEKFNSSITKTKNNIALLKGETSGVGKALSGLGSQFAAIGAGVAAAFSVQAVIQFASASIDAFLEAEVNANNLKNALQEVGDEGEIAFKNLIKQSEDLAQVGKTVFTDDDIQRAQAQLANFGLTADEIEKLIPKLADYASATQQNIVDASAKVGNALLGQGKEFKKYGIIVSATKTSTENYNEVLDGLEKFSGRAEAATKTLSGQLASQKREVEELQESIGERLAPAWVKVKGAVLSFIVTILDGNGGLNTRLKNLKTTAEETALILGNVTGNVKDKSLAGYIELSKGINGLDKALRESNGSIEVFDKSVASLAKDQKQLDITTDEGISRYRIYTEGIRKLTNTYKELNPELKNTIDLSKKSTEDLLALKDSSADDRDLVIQIDRELKAREKLAKAQSLAAAAAKKAAEEAKKAQEEINKLSEENVKNQEDLRKQQVGGESDLINQAADLQLVALSEQLISQEDYAKKSVEIEIERQKQLLAIADLSFEERKAIENKLNELTIGQNRAKTDIVLKENEDLFKKLSDQAEAAGDEETQRYYKQLKDREELQKQALDASLELATQIADAIFDVQRNNLDRQQQAETDALEKEKNAKLSNKRLTEQQKDAINKEFAAKELALKKKQFEEDKRFSINEALIKGALAVIQALASGPPPGNFILALAVAAATAVEIGTIESQKFAKGTKKAKGGMAMVGEQGAEFMYVPQNAKILTAKQTKQHSGLIDAMYDGRLDKLIHQDYILPALQKQKSEFAKKKEQTFSNNLAKSLIFNGLTGNEMEKIRRKGTDINNVDELVGKLADIILTSKNPRRF